MVTAVERHATVSVDPRYGVWVPQSAQVLVPFVPQKSDVLNPDANSASLVPSSASSVNG